MKDFFRFCKEKKNTILFFPAMLAVFGVTFALFRLPFAVFLYPAGLTLLAGILCLLIRYFKEKERLDTNLEQKELLLQTGKAFPVLESRMEEELWHLSLELREEMKALETRMSGDLRNRQEYYTLWAHQIKIPIAAMKLSLEGKDSGEARLLRAELFRTEQYADMVMTYVRLEDSASDFVFRKQALAPILTESIRRFSGEFILRKLSLTMEPVDCEVLTDEKWFSFVFEQILSNALKYTQEGGVAVAMAAPGILTVTDTGIGIAEEDLPRVFEKGFTGCNGREDKRASGIGLYLAKRVCDRLGIGIRIASEAGKGTCVTLDLNRKDVDAKD